MLLLNLFSNLVTDKSCLFFNIDIYYKMKLNYKLHKLSNLNLFFSSSAIFPYFPIHKLCKVPEILNPISNQLQATFGSFKFSRIVVDNKQAPFCSKQTLSFIFTRYFCSPCRSCTENLKTINKIVFLSPSKLCREVWKK